MQKIKVLIAIIFFCQLSFAQKGTITGTVTDENQEGIPFAAIFVMYEGITLGGGTVSDFNGNFLVSQLDSGSYDLKFTYVGYSDFIQKDVVLNPGDTLKLDIQLVLDEMELEEIEITEYSMPLIEVDHTMSKTSVSKVEIQSLPTRDLTSIAYSANGVVACSGKKVKIKNIKKNKQAEIFMRGGRVDMAPEPDMSVTDPSDLNPDEELPLENSFTATEEDKMSTFSIDIDHASYTYTEQLIDYGQKPEKTDIRVEEMVNYFDYDYPEPDGDDPFSIYTEVSDCPWNNDHLLLHIGLKGAEYEMSELPASNLVFLVDVSGSMEAANKLDLVIDGLIMMTDQLRPKDRVSIVTYAGNVSIPLLSTSGKEKGKIKLAINSLSSGGGTNGEGGILSAYEIANKNFITGGNNRVILCTDGDFNVGTSSISGLEQLIEEKRQTGVYLTALGFGMGNYKDQTLETLADKGNGNYSYVNDLAEAKKVFKEDLVKNIFTIAKDVKIQMHFNEENVKAFRLIGYDNRKLEHTDFEDDTKDAGEINAGHTVTAMYEIIPQDSKSEYLEAAKKLEATISDQPVELGDADKLGIIKLRYKEPDADKSKEIVKDILPQENELKNTSDNFRWAAAVAIFGLSLQDSDYLKKANLKTAKELAKTAIGKDKKGMRKEFIDLIEKAQKL